MVVDSIQANTRLVNDMQTTADGNYMVFTREGAADRKNGIVIADTHDPLHPKEIAQFVDGVAVRRALGLHLREPASTASTSSSPTTAPAPSTS